MKPIFAILICHLPEREQLLERLVKALNIQRSLNALENTGCDVIMLLNTDNREKSTGVKRNELVKQAMEKGATHIAHFDDDDLPGPNYIKLNVEAAKGDYDCASLIGQIYWSGKPGKPFYHSKDITEWWEDDEKYYRCVNHLNCQKLSLVQGIPFPDQVFGEDGKQSYAMRDAGIFKNEYKIEEVIYHYFVGNPKHAL